VISKHGLVEPDIEIHVGYVTTLQSSPDPVIGRCAKERLHVVEFDDWMIEVKEA